MADDLAVRRIHDGVECERNAVDADAVVGIEGLLVAAALVVRVHAPAVEEAVAIELPVEADRARKQIVLRDLPNVGQPVVAVVDAE